MRDRKYSLLLGLAGLMLLAACDNIFDIPADQPPSVSGYGTVNIVFTGEETAKTALPPVFDTPNLFSEIEYTFTSGGVDKDYTQTGNTFTLPVGTGYTVTVKAYNKKEGTDFLVAQGESASFNVTNSTNTPVTVTLSPVDDDIDTGKFSYTINYPTGTTLTMNLKPWNNNTPVLEITDDTGTPKTGLKDNLNVGSYLLTVNVLDTNNKYAGFIDIVRIYPSLTTTASYTIEAGDLITPVPPFVAVTDIEGVPTTGTVGTALPLTGTVAPNNATKTTIVWSIKDQGGTGSTITGSNVTATAAGTLTVTATITDGEAVGTNYTKDFEIEFSNAFVAVTGIEDVPTTGTVGTPLALTGTVAPNNATNQTIEWTVKAAGTTNASISGSSLSATAAGTVKVTATITYGATASSNYTQDFDIEFKTNAHILAELLNDGSNYDPAVAEVTAGNGGSGDNWHVELYVSTVNLSSLDSTKTAILNALDLSDTRLDIVNTCTITLGGTQKLNLTGGINLPANTNLTFAHETPSTANPDITVNATLESPDTPIVTFGGRNEILTGSTLMVGQGILLQIVNTPAVAGNGLYIDNTSTLAINGNLWIDSNAVVKCEKAVTTVATTSVVVGIDAELYVYDFDSVADITAGTKIKALQNSILNFGSGWVLITKDYLSSNAPAGAPAGGDFKIGATGSITLVKGGSWTLQSMNIDGPVTVCGGYIEGTNPAARAAVVVTYPITLNGTLTIGKDDNGRPGDSHLVVMSSSLGNGKIINGGSGVINLATNGSWMAVPTADEGNVIEPTGGTPNTSADVIFYYGGVKYDSSASGTPISNTTSLWTRWDKQP